MFFEKSMHRLVIAFIPLLPVTLLARHLLNPYGVLEIPFILKKWHAPSKPQDYFF